MAGPAPHRVRSAREALGLSQAQLAAAARLSRQSIGAIEAGRAVPAVDVALRIAAALQRSVEQLFAAPAAAAPLVTEPTGTLRAEACASERVALAHIADRWLSYPLSGDAARTSADAVTLGEQRRSSPRRRSGAPVLSVTPVRPLQEVQGNLVLMGCALGLGLL